MDKKALIIIDLLKDFLDKKGALYCGDKAREIIPFVKERIKIARRDKEVIIFLADSHKKNDLEFNLFPKHCVENTPGSEIIPELKVKVEDYIIRKTRYSGFYKTDLEEVLKKNNVKEIEVVGVCTSICVMDTVGGLKNRDYSVKIYKESVADFDFAAHKFALKRMENIYGAEIV